jgi:serine/threonine-protein kinase RsbW
VSFPTTPRSRKRWQISESEHAKFHFSATLTELEEGLDVLHRSVEQVREKTGRGEADSSLILFELALSEIGANVLIYGRPQAGSETAVEYVLDLAGGVLEARFADLGAPLHNQVTREMPDALSEGGRGLAIAREALDELSYTREGRVNRWRLVKRL